MLVVDYDLPAFSAIPLRPTLVYNCAFMPSVCNNVKDWLGYLPTTARPVKMHLDANKPRATLRRREVCPGGWVHVPKADGSLRCPQLGQPKWTGYNTDGVRFGPFEPRIHVNGVSRNRLAKRWQRVRFNADGTYTTTVHWQDLGAIMSCDEFPAAT